MNNIKLELYEESLFKWLHQYWQGVVCLNKRVYYYVDHLPEGVDPPYVIYHRRSYAINRRVMPLRLEVNFNLVAVTGSPQREAVLELEKAIANLHHTKNIIQNHQIEITFRLEEIIAPLPKSGGFPYLEAQMKALIYDYDYE